MRENEVWRRNKFGSHEFVRYFRWRWLARLYAWGHTKHGWQLYEVWKKQ